MSVRELLVAAVCAAAMASCGAARPPEEPLPSSTDQDIDVLHERIDCRSSATGTVVVDPKCCADNFNAMGC